MLFLAALSLLCISGCAGRDVREPEQEIIIGVVTKSRNSEYWMSVNAGMEKAAKERNVKTVILSPGYGDRQKNTEKNDTGPAENAGGCPGGIPH